VPTTTNPPEPTTLAHAADGAQVLVDTAPSVEPNPSRISTRPRVGTLTAHLAGISLLQATSMAITAILPVIARKQFGASDWETLLITASPTVCFCLSIFWHALFQRVQFGRYLAIYWLVACLPVACIALTAGSFAWLLTCHLLACIGASGYHPAAGDLMKSLYPTASRGRVYSLLWGGSLLVSAIASFGLGWWLTHDAFAYRLALPIAAALQLVGCLVLVALERSHRARTPRPDAGKPWGLATLVDPVLHMRRVLKDDPVFARYEGAYMTYGVGWMIAYALVPILVTDKLHLNYQEVAKSTNVSYLIAMVCALPLAGLLLDRAGAMRSTALSFAMLTLYPLGLIATQNDTQLLWVSVWYGVAHAGASVGWMLGPVSLAPTPEKVPQYVAIHATLVGVRGAIFQFVGVWLYRLTGSFTLPLALAAIGYAWSAWQMWKLHSRSVVSKTR
jgi:MFS family permease